MSAPEEQDRSSILARRALFVASALASVTRAAVSEAEEVDEPLPVCPASEPLPGVLDEARARFSAGAARAADGAFEEASQLFREAYGLVPRAKVAVAAMDADEQRGALVEAFELGTEHLRCFGPEPAIEEKLQRLATATAVVVIRLEDPSGVLVRLDDRSISRRRARDGVRLMPGRHAVRVLRDGATLERVVEVRAGELVEIRFGALPPPQPCLSPPLPCLSPPPPPPAEDTLVRLQGGALAPVVALAPSGSPIALAGTGAHLEIAVQPTDGVWLTADVFGGVLAARDFVGGFGGGGVDLELRPIEAYGLGFGFSGGYLTASSDRPQRLSSSGFFGPVLVPASIFAGPFFLEARVPIWFSEVAADGGTSLGLGVVAPHVVVGVGAPIAKRAARVDVAREGSSRCEAPRSGRGRGGQPR
ncbi:MAG: hypothetical protein JNL21_32440 [Myxococcales bacterium]|nr:hypothetical protein [Myxococcales bacterium]